MTEPIVLSLEAVRRFIEQTQPVTIAQLQRHFKIGYSYARQLLEALKDELHDAADPSGIVAYRSCDAEVVEKARLAKIAEDLNTPVAVAEQWQPLLPMPELHKTLSMSVHFRESSMAYIRHGFIPNDMSDRWFCYAVSPEIVRLHRSWTGCFIFELRFRVSGSDEWELYELLVNQDPDQYRSTDDKLSRESALQVVRNYLLMPRLSYPQFYPVE